MRYHFIVVRKAIYSSIAEVDKKMVIVFDTMQISWGGLPLALIVFSTDKASIDVIIGEGDATYLF